VLGGAALVALGPAAAVDVEDGGVVLGVLGQVEVELVADLVGVLAVVIGDVLDGLDLEGLGLVLREGGGGQNGQQQSECGKSHRMRPQAPCVGGLGVDVRGGDGGRKRIRGGSGPAVGDGP